MKYFSEIHVHMSQVYYHQIQIKLINIPNV